MMFQQDNNQESYQINNQPKPRLSVQVSLNGLSFLLSDPVSNETLFFEEITFSGTYNPEEVLLEIQKFYQDHTQLQVEMDEVFVCHENNLYALVPKPVFQEDALANYLKFNTKILPTDYITFDELNHFDLVIVYVPFTNINNYFFELFGEFTFKHSTSVFIEHILGKERNDVDPKMYVHVHKRQMDLLATKNKNVLLFNSFDCHTPEDFLYYILFTAEQLQLNSEEFPLYLSGKITTDDETYKLAYEYIRNIEIQSPTNSQDVGSSVHSLLIQN